MSQVAPLPVIHKVDHDKCTGCAVCVENCPQEVMEIFQMGLKKKARLKDPELCVVCLYCQKMCPYGAVTVDLPGHELW